MSQRSWQGMLNPASKGASRKEYHVHFALSQIRLPELSFQKPFVNRWRTSSSIFPSYYFPTCSLHDGWAVLLFHRPAVTLSLTPNALCWLHLCKRKFRSYPKPHFRHNCCTDYTWLPLSLFIPFPSAVPTLTKTAPQGSSGPRLLALLSEHRWVPCPVLLLSPPPGLAWPRGRDEPSDSWPV